MDHGSSFSYICHQCGRCCRDQVITLSPYDVIRIARAAEISTSDVVRKYTLRRGSILRFRSDGTCMFLDGMRCTIHRGRPLACRLYPLGLQRNPGGSESFVQLEPAVGSLGVYGADATVAAFLAQQGVRNYFDAIAAYSRLLSSICERITALVDFDATEPREFWRIATREALAEDNFDPNPLIDALFDADRFPLTPISTDPPAVAHVAALEAIISHESRPAILAATAVMLAISLGYPPRFGPPAP
jgi:uncharacterized protein